MDQTNFKLPDNSEQVGDIQRKLASLNFYDGQRTEHLIDLAPALKKFQQKYRTAENKIDINGECDHATWLELNKRAGSLLSETWQFELDALRGGAFPKEVLPASKTEVIRRSHASNLAGLAFSGGGIRSATFNLGFMQALAENKLLRDFDYLSTVSGGGYIGSWLSKWIKEMGGDVLKVEQRLTPGSKQAPIKHEPDEIKFLRQYSNYLTPQSGMFSADTWTLAANYIRNTALNLCIFISLLAAVISLPGLLTWVIVRYHQSHAANFATVGVTAFLFAVFFIALSISSIPDPTKKHRITSQSQRSIILLVVLPLMIAGVCGSIAIWEYRNDMRYVWNAVDILAAYDENQPVWRAIPAFFSVEKVHKAILYTLLPGLLYFTIWLAGWGSAQILNRSVSPASPYHDARDRRLQWKTLAQEGVGHILCAIGAFAVGTLLLVNSVQWLEALIGKQTPPELSLVHLACFGMPYMLSVFGVTMILMVGLIGRLYTDRSREWWSRQGGWTSIFAISWMALFSLTLYSPPLLAWVHQQSDGWGDTLIASGWIGTTLLGLAASRSSATGDMTSNPRLELMAQAAPYVFSTGILAIVATMVHFIVNPEHSLHLNAAPNTGIGEFIRLSFIDRKATGLYPQLIALAIFLCIGFVLAWRLDINKFSLYMMTRNRLVRAYLGASSKHRRPHPFTGFDPNDDPPLASLCKTSDNQVQRPYHIINAALNLVGGNELAWQTRKTTGFVFTPAFCGYEMPRMPAANDQETMQNAKRGCFRPTETYGGNGNFLTDEDQGTRLGMAATVSGAAVSPRMGYHSSPPLAFLMTLFNLRLGRWCGNPRKTKWQESSPRIGLFCLIAELFGLTDANADYLYLSDGGHFENLGLYELVRRRCRLIVVVDASADGKLHFEDLGNAIRKCYTDLRIEIDIDVGAIDLCPKSEFSSEHCVAGKIYYGKVDPDAPDGVLLYIKPSLTGLELADVLNHRKTDPGFPHQMPLGRWFDETHFESYRSLGYRIGSAALKEAAAKTLSATGDPDSDRHGVTALADALLEQWKRPR